MSIITRIRAAIARATARRQLERDRMRLLIIEERGSFNWAKKPIEVRSDFLGRTLTLFEPREIRMNIRTIDQKLTELDSSATYSVAA